MQNTPINFDSKTTDVTPETLILNTQAMGQLMNFAEMMARGTCTVPKHLSGNPADCMAIIMQAARWRMDPFAVAQKTHLVNGTLGYEAQLVNAVIIANAPLKERLRYEWFGDWTRVVGNFITKTSSKGNAYQAPNWTAEDEKGLGVRVWATMKGEVEPRVLELLLSQAQVRNSTLWASDPKQQLAYLGSKRWARLHCPEVILGVYTPDELEEVPEATERKERDITPTRSEPAALPTYTQDQFLENANSWANAITAGKATSEKILAMVSTKYTVPADIQEQIRNLTNEEVA